MDSQGQKMPVASSGHKIHLCHRCGWPFPNPHPSAKHRRTHKKVCGTLEGFKSDLAISDDEHASDDDHHTLSPNLEKRIVKEPYSSGGVGEKSNKSEDDMYSDAKTDLSESGISSRLDDRLEIVKGEVEQMQKTDVQGDVNKTQINKIDASLGNVTGNKDIYDEIGHFLLSDDINSESQRNDDILMEGDKLASVILGSEEGKTSNVTVVNKKDEICDPYDGNAFMSAATLINVEDKPNMEWKKVFVSGKCETVIPKAANDKDVEFSDINHHVATSTNHMDMISIASYNDLEKEQKSGAENANAGNVWELALNGNDTAIQVSEEELCSIGIGSAADLQKFSVHEDHQTARLLGGNMNSNHETVNSLVVGNESCQESGLEAPVILSSVKHSVNSTEFLPSDDAVPEEVSPKIVSGSLENRDVNLEIQQGHRAGIHSTGSDGLSSESKHSGDVASKENTPEQSIPVDSASIFPETDNNRLSFFAKTSESFGPPVDETKHVGDAILFPENCSTIDTEVKEASSASKKCSNENESEFVSSVLSEEQICNVNAATLDSCSTGTVLMDHSSSPSHSQVLHENSINDNKVVESDNALCVSSGSSEDKVNDKGMREKDSISVIDLSRGSSSIADSLEGKWGSISVAETNSLSSPISEANVQGFSQAIHKDHHGKSDDLEPPSFMTLVQSDSNVGKVAALAVSESETVENNQHSKSVPLQSGWFPSLTQVVNESPGRKKNEEIIAKVTNWSMGKEHHNQLKNLMNDAHSPKSKQVPAANQKEEVSKKDNNVVLPDLSSVLPELRKDGTSHKEDGGSPAKYSTVIKKEKKKGKPYWVPFCCSSVNRDL